MSLAFLITYIIISYILFRNNKSNIKNIPLIIKISGIIPFLLLIVYVIYYSEIRLSSAEEVWYAYSFYFLLLSYIITFIFYFFKYIWVLKSKKAIKIPNNNLSIKEIILNKLYLLIIIIVISSYIILNSSIDLLWWDWIFNVLSIFVIFASFFSLIKDKIISLLK